VLLGLLALQGGVQLVDHSLKRATIELRGRLLAQLGVAMNQLAVARLGPVYL
jgi:hypothetical protein